MKIKSIIALGAVSVAAFGTLHAEVDNAKAEVKMTKKEKMLKKFDTDKDGKLSAEEKAAMKAEMAEKKAMKKKEMKEAEEGAEQKPAGEKQADE